MYIPFEDQREEYIQNDSGLLFMGTALNLVSRPWSFDQVRMSQQFFFCLDCRGGTILKQFSLATESFSPFFLLCKV